MHNLAQITKAFNKSANTGFTIKHSKNAKSVVTRFTVYRNSIIGFGKIAGVFNIGDVNSYTEAQLNARFKEAIAQADKDTKLALKTFSK